MDSKKPRNSTAPLRRKPSRPTDLDAVHGRLSDGLSLLCADPIAQLPEGQS
jgi:hypothetical protein